MPTENADQSKALEVLNEMGLRIQQPHPTPQAAMPVRPPEAPVLPTLPRTTNLMGNDSWTREIKAVAGPFAEDRALIGALQTQRRMVESFEALEAIRKNRNPADTASAHLNRASKAYSTMLEAAARNHDATLNTIKGRLVEIADQVEVSLGLQVSHDAAEIRKALRAMTPEARGKAIQAAIDSKDGAIMHAVFTGREITTGVNDVQRNSFRRRAEEKYSPDLLKLRQGLEKAEALVKGAFQDLFAVESMVSGNPEVATAFEKQTAASDEAWLNFNRAIS